MWARRERYFSPQLGTLLVLVMNLATGKGLIPFDCCLVTATCGCKGCPQTGAPCAQCPRTEHGAQMGLDTSGRWPLPPEKPHQIGQERSAEVFHKCPSKTGKSVMRQRLGYTGLPVTRSYLEVTGLRVYCCAVLGMLTQLMIGYLSGTEVFPYTKSYDRPDPMNRGGRVQCCSNVQPSSTREALAPSVRYSSPIIRL